jgi:hypothetical protein
VKLSKAAVQGFVKLLQYLRIEHLLGEEVHNSSGSYSTVEKAEQLFTRTEVFDI